MALIRLMNCSVKDLLNFIGRRTTMKSRKTVALALFSAPIAVACALLQAPSQAPAGARSEAPYHATEMSKSQSGADATTAKARSKTASVTRASSLATLVNISILPSSISIAGPRYGQRILVEGTFRDGHQEELTSQANISVADSTIATVSKENRLLPARDGRATVTATVQGHRATAPLAVSGLSTAKTWSFSNDVLPVMTKV